MATSNNNYLFLEGINRLQKIMINIGLLGPKRKWSASHEEEMLIDARSRMDARATKLDLVTLLAFFK